MGRDLYLALDQGTSSSRALVFDARGRLHAQARRPLAAQHPQPGWAEQDPEAIWASQLEAAREALRSAGGAQRFRAIAIANQRETSVVWERSSLTPIAPAIVWHCRRTAEQAAALSDAHGDEFRRRTGLTPDAYFSAPKLAWLLDHTPGAREQAERGELALGTVDSWLIARLTGGAAHVTDRTNASRTLLYNLQTESWDPQLAAWTNVPAAALPQVRPSRGLFGETTAELFGEPLPILAVAGDQQAALFGQDCRSPGAAKCTYGTGAFVLARSDASDTTDATGEPPPGLLLTAAADAPDALALEGGVFTVGALIDWMVAELGIAADAAELSRLAASTPHSGGVAILPALAGIGAPHWQPHARGMIAGLSAGTTRAQIARAALEAIAFRVREIVEAFPAPIRELRVDGGLANSDALLQIQADALQQPVLRPANLETTALGAARLAIEADLDAPPPRELAYTTVEPRADLESVWQRWRNLRPAADLYAEAGTTDA